MTVTLRRCLVLKEMYGMSPRPPAADYTAVCRRRIDPAKCFGDNYAGVGLAKYSYRLIFRALNSLVLHC